MFLTSTMSALYLAAAKDNVDEVRRLIADGVDIDTPYDDGNTALHFAAAFAQTENARVLIEAGADLHARNNIDQTPLRRAIAWYGEDSEIARVLREAMAKQGG